MSSTLTTASAGRLTTVRQRSLAAGLAIAAAIALPQVVHLVGTATGLGDSLARMLLVMHLPVILVGLLAGPAVGVVVGLAAPLLAHLLTGLPLTVVLPLMTIEVAGYGLVAGLLWRVPIAAVWKVLAAQVAGRVATLAVIGVAGLFTQAAWASSPGAWWAALWTGLVGIAVQLAIIPVVMSLVGRRS